MFPSLLRLSVQPCLPDAASTPKAQATSLPQKQGCTQGTLVALLSFHCTLSTVSLCKEQVVAANQDTWVPFFISVVNELF